MLFVHVKSLHVSVYPFMKSFCVLHSNPSMSREIVLIFIKRFGIAITKDESNANQKRKDDGNSKFPLKGMFLKIKDDLENIFLDNQGDIDAVRETVLDLEDFLSECQAMSKKRMPRKRGLMNCYSPSEYIYINKTGIQLRKITKKLQRMRKPGPATYEEKTETGLSETLSEYQWSYGSVDTSKIYGWDLKVKEINMTLLKEDHDGLNMAGIVGNFGTGKTALAQKIFMSDDVMDAFCLRLWVCVSPNCEPRDLVWRMLDNLGVENVQLMLDQKGDKDELGVLLFLLYVELMEKRYLIVFDDVCEAQNWHTSLDEQPPESGEWTDRLAYGLPKGSGSAIIVTSRFPEVAKKIVGRLNIHYPDRILEDNAWLLFKTAYEEESQSFDEKLETLKTAITNKCDGLPLALKTAGKELARSHPTQQDDEKRKPETDDSSKPHTNEISMPSVTNTDNPQAEEKGESQGGDTGQSIVDDINKQDTDEIRKQKTDSKSNTKKRDYDNAEPKEENTGESKQLEDGKAESRPANNNTKSVSANKDTTQVDTTNKQDVINETNETAT